MQLTTISGKSPLTGAIRYAITGIDRLRPYLDHGILGLDDNAAERGMRAIACTLIETAKINAVDPLAWLADTIARIPDYEITKVDHLLPWCWNGERSGRAIAVDLGQSGLLRSLCRALGPPSPGSHAGST